MPRPLRHSRHSRHSGTLRQLALRGATRCVSCLALCCALAALPVAGTGAQAAATGEEVRAIHELLARGQAELALQRLQSRDGGLTLANGGSSEAELRFLRGVALMDLQRNAEALAWFERMTQDHPELPDPFNNIALLHARAGRLEPARQALETALRNDPSYRVARANLGLVYLMLAVQAWEQVAAGGPVDPAFTRRLEGARTLLAQAGSQAASTTAVSPSPRSPR